MSNEAYDGMWDTPLAAFPGSAEARQPLATTNNVCIASLRSKVESAEIVLRDLRQQLQLAERQRQDSILRITPLGSLDGNLMLPGGPDYDVTYSNAYGFAADGISAQQSSEIDQPFQYDPAAFDWQDVTLRASDSSMFPEQLIPVTEGPRIEQQVHATLHRNEQSLGMSYPSPNSPAHAQALLDLGEPFPCVDPGDLLSEDLLSVLESYGQEHIIHERTTAPTETTMPFQEQCSLKRRRLGSEERESRKLVRREGACLRCRIYRMKCDLGMPCRNCLKVRDTAKIFKQPCYRVALKDVYPFRGGNSRTGHVRSVLPKFSWSSDCPQVRKVRLTSLFAGASTSQTPTLSVNLRRFICSPNDALSEPFEAPDGEKMVIDFPPYACVDVESLRMERAIEVYLDACQPFAERTMDLTIEDDIIRASLHEARRYAKSRNTIVFHALKIQSAIYVASILPVIVSNDTLGISPVNNEKFAMHGKVPIPISLDHQLDTLTIRYAERNLKPIVTGLKALIFSRKDKREVWYEIFLTMMVLLSTLESVFAQEVCFVEKYVGLDNHKLATASYVKGRMIAEWQASAKNLIYHFRCVLKGMVPFSRTWDPDDRERSHLDQHAMTYIRHMSDKIARRRDELSELCAMDLDNDQGKPLVWIAQMLIDE